MNRLNKTYRSLIYSFLSILFIVGFLFTQFSTVNPLSSKISNIVNNDLPKVKAAGTVTLTGVPKFAYSTKYSNAQFDRCDPGSDNQPGGNFYRAYSGGFNCGYTNPGVYATYPITNGNVCNYVRGIIAIKNGACGQSQPISYGYNKGTGQAQLISNFNVEFTYNPADNGFTTDPGNSRARTVARFIQNNVQIDANSKISLQGCNGSVCTAPVFDDAYRVSLVPSSLPLDVVDIDSDPRVLTTAILMGGDQLGNTLTSSNFPTKKGWEVPNGSDVTQIWAQRIYNFASPQQCFKRNTANPEDVLYDNSNSSSLFRTYQVYDPANDPYNYGTYAKQNAGNLNINMPPTVAVNQIPTGAYNIIIDVLDSCGIYNVGALSDQTNINITPLTPVLTPTATKTPTSSPTPVPAATVTCNMTVAPTAVKSPSYVFNTPGSVFTLSFAGSTNVNINTSLITIEARNSIGVVPGLAQTVTAFQTVPTAYTTSTATYTYSQFQNFFDAADTISFQAIVPKTANNRPLSCNFRIKYAPYYSPSIVTTPSGGTTSAAGVRCSVNAGVVNNSDPYTLLFSIKAKASSIPNAYLSKVNVVLAPSNYAGSYSFNNVGTASPAPTLNQNIFVGSSDQSQVPAGSGITVTMSSPNPFISDTAPPTTTNVNQGYFYFQVKFNPASKASLDYFINNNVNNQFKMWVFVQDSSGQYNATGQTDITPVFNTYDQCTRPYYKTTNGDVRVSDKTSARYKRLLRIIPSAEIAIDYTNIPNLIANDFLIEADGINSVDCQKASRLRLNNTSSRFCITTNNTTNIDAAFRQMSSIESSLTNEVASTSTQYKVVTITSSTGTFPTGFSVQSLNTMTINLGQVSNTTPKILVKVQAGIQNVNIIDTTASSVTDFILWCQTPSCSIKVNPLNANISTFNTTASSGLITYDYPNSATVKSFLRKNNRLYFNFNSADLDAGKTRTVNLINPNVNGVKYFYDGAIMTSGYFYTNTSDDVNILKGLVVARGIIMSGSGVATTNKNLYFKNFYQNGFANPILYIDFDPKYTFVFNDILKQPAETVPRKIVGL